MRLYIGDGGGTDYFDDFYLGAVNKVLNPGLENGTSPWALSTHWSRAGDDKYSGAYSLKCSGGDPNSPDWCYTTQNIDVKTYTNYTLTAYAKTNATGGRVGTVMKITDASITPLANANVVYVCNNLWAKYTITFNSGRNNTINILVAEGGFTSYFDNFELHINYVCNPGFETGNTDHWNFGAHFYIATDDKYAEIYSAKLSGTVDWCGLDQMISVKPYTNYTWTVYAKCNPESGYAITFSAYASLWNPVSNITYANTNSWIQYTINFNSGDKNLLWLHSADGGGTNYFDNYDFTQC